MTFCPLICGHRLLMSGLGPFGVSLGVSGKTATGPLERHRIEVAGRGAGAVEGEEASVHGSLPLVDACLTLAGGRAEPIAATPRD